MKHFNMYLKGNEIYVKTEDEQAINKLGINIEDAVEFRGTVDAIINTLTDEQAIEAPILFPVWKDGIAYKVGDRVRYAGKLYKVVLDHTSIPGWEPLYAASLFAALLIDKENNSILEWVQPDSTNPYMENDKVIHNEKFWISIVNNNVWEPGTVGAPWEEYIINWENGVSYALNQKVKYDGKIYISLIAENVSELSNTEHWMEFIEIVEPEMPEEIVPEDESAEWVSDNLYMMGDKVIFEGSTYESLIDNNVWSPADYPAGWSVVE